MTLKARLGLLMLAALLVLPWVVLAQETTEYVSEDGLLTVTYPAEWVAEPQEFPAVRLGTSAEAIARTNDDEVAEAGDITLQIAILPTEFLGQLGIDLEEELEPAELSQVVAEAFLGQASNNAENVKLGEAVIVEQEDAEPLAYIPYTRLDTQVRGLLISYPLTDDITLIGTGTVFADDFDEELAEAIIEIILTTDYSGTVEDLIAAFEG